MVTYDHEFFNVTNETYSMSLPHASCFQCFVTIRQTGTALLESDASLGIEAVNLCIVIISIIAVTPSFEVFYPLSVHNKRNVSISHWRMFLPLTSFASHPMIMQAFIHKNELSLRPSSFNLQRPNNTERSVVLFYSCCQLDALLEGESIKKVSSSGK